MREDRRYASASDVSRNPTGAQAVYFEVVGRIQLVETIAVGGSIKEIMRLRKQYGHGRWRKMKGIADVRLVNGMASVAER